MRRNNRVCIIERSLLLKVKISSTTHVQLLRWPHGIQQQRTCQSCWRSIVPVALSSILGSCPDLCKYYAHINTNKSVLTTLNRNALLIYSYTLNKVYGELFLDNAVYLGYNFTWPELRLFVIWRKKKKKCYHIFCKVTFAQTFFFC